MILWQILIMGYLAILSCSNFSFIFSFLNFSFFFFQLISDFYTKSFFVFAITIGLMIFLFSFYYMKKFEHYLFIFFMSLFLIFMIFLVMSNNLFTMFFGWEGVGIMSFLLIGWNNSREEASFSSKKAIFYNRISDFFFLTLILAENISMKNFFFSTKILKNENFFFWKNLIFFFFILGIIGKSAQFFFHPWLTSAMEGPTPVSALLHSSTMVVAGVFLFFKLFFFVNSSEMVMIFLCLISCFTMFFTSISAFFYNDQKKIIALSTTSQLSLMMFLLSMGCKDLAFFHMMCHGFFKALIFLSGGFFIHMNSNNQNISKMKFKIKLANFQFIIFLLSNIGLMGLPFFGAFFSKHFILENFLNNPTISFCFFLLFFSFSFTLGYSLKLIFSMNSKKLNFSNISEKNKKNFFFFPFIFLVILTIFFGIMMSNFFFWFFDFLIFWFFDFLIFWFFLSGFLIFFFFKFSSSNFWFNFMFSSFFNQFFFFKITKKNINLLESNLEKGFPLLMIKKFSLNQIFFFSNLKFNSIFNQNFHMILCNFFLVFLLILF